MGPFDLEKALAGTPVITRKGAPVATEEEAIKRRKELRAAIAKATGAGYAVPECTCAAKDMTFGRCCKVTPNAELSRVAAGDESE